ncbi:MAG TPA: HAMP domain-containing protein, partial [Xanthobacteraceae bacterium]|nr:HAMP domain-containing protein [Xanthobacteraceae bacterium]
MSRLFNRVLNLRIGTKLALIAGISILLVAAILVSEILGAGRVKRENAYAVTQLTIARDAVDAKASTRGMQMGVRDIRLARSPEDLKKGADYLATNLRSVNKFADDILKVTDPADRQRVDKLKALASQYASEAKALEKLKADIIDFEVKTGGGVDAVANQKVADIARERTLPLAAEMEALANQVVDAAKHKSQEAFERAAAEEVFTERLGLAIGLAAALLLIGSAVFSVFTIARPMKALTGGMLELADGNFDVVLPGLGRKDEIGDVAAAVETFKVKSAEKARREAEAKAELDRKALAEKAERDRIEAEQKVEADKRAAAEREAATAKVMSEFDAAVGGIVKAAMA